MEDKNLRTHPSKTINRLPGHIGSSRKSAKMVGLDSRRYSRKYTTAKQYAKANPLPSRKMERPDNDSRHHGQNKVHHNVEAAVEEAIVRVNRGVPAVGFRFQRGIPQCRRNIALGERKNHGEYIDGGVDCQQGI